MIIKQLTISFFIIIFIGLTSTISARANEVNGWFGEETSGGGIAIADINKNGIPDLVVFNIDHPEGGNIGYYRVGFDLRSNKDVSQWSPLMKVGGFVDGYGIVDHGWFGEDTAAADIAISDLNKNGLPDLIIFHIDDADENAGYYRVGWDLNPGGVVSRWDDHLLNPIMVPGWFASKKTQSEELQGAGIAVADLNKNGKPELIIFHITHASHLDKNYGYYRIGWDLDSNGDASWKGDDLDRDLLEKVWIWFGSHNQGADIAVAELNQNDKPELIVFNIDHTDHGNVGYYRIGWDLNIHIVNGVTKWDQPEALNGWMGEISSAAGIDILSTVPNGANIIYFTVARFEPSFRVGASTVNNGVYYDDWICFGPCVTNGEGAESAEAGSGFIEEQTVRSEKAAFGSLEDNTDRMGMNLDSFDLSTPDPLICQQACADKPECKAFTYVKPGFQGTNARCYLKYSIPEAASNDCCISGVKGGITAMVVQPGFILPAQS